jgi:hypothetical protein
MVEDDFFFIRAKKEVTGVEYVGSYAFCCGVAPEKVVVKCCDGKLYVQCLTGKLQKLWISGFSEKLKSKNDIFYQHRDLRCLT